jgi:Brp/Blh family beta-carotene 15,15'-monooxygenase
VAATISEGARRTLACATFTLSWLPVGVLTGFFTFGLHLPRELYYVPFGASLLILGLPHGALDHLAPGRISSSGSTTRSILAVALLYMTLGPLYLALWFAAPTYAFLLLILLTWFHWGQGDLWTSAFLLRGEPFRSRLVRLLTIFIRGGLPMLVPLLAFPEAYKTTARSAAGAFGGAPGGLDPLFEPAFRIPAGAVFATVTLLTLYLGYRGAGTKNRTAWKIEAAETLLLAAYFVLVPPVLAVGLYFCLWHSTRHIARLMLIEERSSASLEQGGLAPAVIIFARESAPLTLVALGVLGALYLLTPGGTGSLSGLLGLYLVMISILTLPHVVVVSWMDYQQDLWKRTGQ